MIHTSRLIRYAPSGVNTPLLRKLAIITGATSGIGKAYAGYFASQGYDLLITGRREKVIMHVASELLAIYSVNIDVVIADLSKHEDLTFLLQVIGKRKSVDVLVNNAGYGTDGRFSEDEIEHQLNMLKVHVNAPLMLIHKVLPAMIGNKNGIIINVSSLAAYLPSAGNTMYTGTKSFLKNFTESLHMDVSHYGIQVQCLCPGFVYSDFHKDKSFSEDTLLHGGIPWMKPSDVVDYSIHCLTKGQVVCIPGMWNRLVSLLSTTVPRNIYYLVADKLERKIKKGKHLPDLAYAKTGQGKPVQPIGDLS